MSELVICKQCGVELEQEMAVCPLCDLPVGDDKIEVRSAKENSRQETLRPDLLKRILLQIASVLLLSGILATLIIDLATAGRVTWSVYPVSFCLMTLPYVLFGGLWSAKLVSKITAGWMVSSVVLVLIHFAIGGGWPLKLALPILCITNVVSIIFAFIVGNLEVKGLNIVAILFIGIAIVCLLIETIVSYYFHGNASLRWSAIVAACLIPVTAVIIFMHFKTKNNFELRKIFHT